MFSCEVALMLHCIPQFVVSVNIKMTLKTSIRYQEIKPTRYEAKKQTVLHVQTDLKET